MLDEREFIFRYQPEGPNGASQAFLVIAPDEDTATSVARKAADGIAFVLCAACELDARPDLLAELRRRTPQGIGPEVENGKKLPQVPKLEWRPKLGSLA
jgi:hypothetical protein